MLLMHLSQEAAKPRKRKQRQASLSLDARGGWPSLASHACSPVLDTPNMPLCPPAHAALLHTQTLTTGSSEMTATRRLAINA